MILSHRTTPVTESQFVITNSISFLGANNTLLIYSHIKVTICLLTSFKTEICSVHFITKYTLHIVKSKKSTLFFCAFWRNDEDHVTCKYVWSQ